MLLLLLLLLSSLSCCRGTFLNYSCFHLPRIIIIIIRIIMITIIIIIIILISSAHRLNLSFHIARVLFTFICLHPTNHPTSSSQSTVYSSSLVVYIYASFNLIAIVKLHYNSGIAIVINTATIIKIFIVSSSSSSSIVISGVAGIVAADTRYSFPL